MSAGCEPGRELDGYIATKVCGWKRIPMEIRQGIGIREKVVPHERWITPWGACFRTQGKSLDTPNCTGVYYFSTMWSAAVSLKQYFEGGLFGLRQRENGCACRIHHPVELWDTGWVEGQTPAHAYCLAALQALECGACPRYHPPETQEAQAEVARI